jgi:hypothetical protein
MKVNKGTASSGYLAGRLPEPLQQESKHFEVFLSMIRVTLATTLVLFASLASLAAQTTPAAPATLLPPTHEHFPSDYKVSACAQAAGACRSFDPDKIQGAARSFLGLTLLDTWVHAHSEEVLAAFAPICAKRASCLGTLGNNFLFCDDIVTPEFREVCDVRFPKSKSMEDWEQCHAFAEIYALGMDSNALDQGEAAQTCAAGQPRSSGTLDVWVEPSVISPDNKGYITFYALDTATHIPIAAEVRLQGEIVVDIANPAGTTATYYPFKYTPKFRRIPNAEGHTDVAPSLVTIESPYYPKVTMNLPVKMPQMIVEMNPPVANLKPGENTVTIAARDAESGKPVEARVMIGDRWGGETNKPLKLLVPARGAGMPEVWVTSLFDRYSDQVVVPKGKGQTRASR